MSDGSTKIKNGLNLQPVSADPNNPAEGDLQFSDGTARAKGLWQYSNGNWAEIGGGGQGGINYLAGDNSDAENGIGDWVTYADAAGENAVDGTGGTALGVTLTQNTTDPLRETADFKFSKDAADRQGEGASVDFTIDNADKAQKLTISFDYDASNANYADDDIRIAIYDVTNSNLIRVNGEDLKGGKGTHLAQFQTAADSTSYRLIIHQSSTNATAYDVYLDNISVGPGASTGTNQEVVVRAAGNNGQIISANIEDIVFEIVEDTTNSWGSGDTLFTTPETGNYIFRGSVDITALTSFSLDMYVDGSKAYRMKASGSATRSPMDFTHVVYLTKGQTVGIRSSVNVTLSNTSSEHYLHIQKLGTSAEARAAVGGGREVVVQAYGNSGQVITANTTDIPFGTTGIEDTTAAWDGDQFTCPETGYYDIHYSLRYSTQIQGTFRLYVDAVATNYANVAEASTEFPNGNFTSVLLNKGQVLSLRMDQTRTLNSSAPQLHRISIAKRSSPQSQLETETVAARYTSDSGQAIGTGYTDMVYEDLDFDTHNAYNTSTGDYTVPVSGYYNIECSIESASFAFNINSVIEIQIRVNGNLKTGKYLRSASTHTSLFMLESNLNTILLNKGDIVDVRARRTSSAGNLSTYNLRNFFSITRIK